MTGFYFTARGDWRKFVICLFGFLIARVVVTRLTRTPRTEFMHLSTDQLILWQQGFLKLNGTIVYTWGLMLVLVVGSRSDHSSAYHRNLHFGLAMRPGNHRPRHGETN